MNVRGPKNMKKPRIKGRVLQRTLENFRSTKGQITPIHQNVAHHEDSHTAPPSLRCGFAKPLGKNERNGHR